MLVVLIVLVSLVAPVHAATRRSNLEALVAEVMPKEEYDRELTQFDRSRLGKKFLKAGMALHTERARLQSR